MRITLSLIIYGLLLNAGYFMTFLWGRISWKRAHELGWRGLLIDRYMIISFALTLLSVGTGILYTARVLTGIRTGEWSALTPGILGYMVLAGLSTITVAYFGFVWAVRLDGGTRRWKFFMATSFLWVLGSVVFSQFMY